MVVLVKYNRRAVVRVGLVALFAHDVLDVQTQLDLFHTRSAAARVTLARHVRVGRRIRILARLGCVGRVGYFDFVVCVSH